MNPKKCLIDVRSAGQSHDGFRGVTMQRMNNKNKAYLTCEPLNALRNIYGTSCPNWSPIQNDLEKDAVRAVPL